MKKIITIVLIAASFYSCKKGDVSAPDFDVTADKLSIKANETVNFAFEGNPDFITFYSGEAGRVYANNQRISVAGIATFDFTSTSSQGAQLNTLALLVSTDFAGAGVDNTGTVTNIGKATWTDITSKAALSTGASTPSGKIDLTDLANANKPIYLAFKYTSAAGSIQKKWTIASPKVVNTLPDGTAYTIADHTSGGIASYSSSNIISPGWVSSNVLNTYNWTLSSTTFTITGAATAVTATTPAETWLFSGPINLRKTAPDFGVLLKDITNAPVPYAYTFKTAGVYKVTFVGINNNVFGEKEKVKEFTITVQ